MARLGDICTVYTGTGFPTQYQGETSGDYPFYKVGDISKNVTKGNVYLQECDNYISEEVAKKLKGTIVPADTVVFAKIGEAVKLNRRAITVKNCLVDNNAMGVCPDQEKLNLSYFYHYMCSIKLETFAEATTVPSVKKSAIENIDIPLPAYEDQTNISSIMDSVCELICHKKHQINLLDELVKSRFIEMFGDPVKNNMEWQTQKLNDVCDGIGDGLHGTPEYDECGEYPFINGNNLMDGKIIITSATKMVSEKTYMKHFVDVSHNAILISINGTLGKLAFYNGEKVMLGKSACYCNLMPTVNKVFVYGVMQSDAFAEFLDISSTKSTIKNVGLKAMREFDLILPPINLQNEFATFVEQTNKLKLEVKESLEKLETLKKSLMQKYFG